MLDQSLYNTEEILALLKLEQTGEDRFRGQSHFMGSPNVFGGQVLGQSLYAASVTVWFHRPLRMDEWLLFEMETPNASGGRGLCLAYVYNEKRELVATLAQEGLIRLHEDRAAKS